MSNTDMLWEMFASGALEKTAPQIAVLCDYESGVNGEGHSGWLYNTENTGGKSAVQSRLMLLQAVLPVHLYQNLERAVKAYGTAQEDEICEAADDHFYAHEQEVTAILQAFADTL